MVVVVEMDRVRAAVSFASNCACCTFTRPSLGRYIFIWWRLYVIVIRMAVHVGAISLWFRPVAVSVRAISIFRRKWTRDCMGTAAAAAAVGTGNLYQRLRPGVASAGERCEPRSTVRRCCRPTFCRAASPVFERQRWRERQGHHIANNGTKAFPGNVSTRVGHRRRAIGNRAHELERPRFFACNSRRRPCVRARDLPHFSRDWRTRRDYLPGCRTQRRHRCLRKVSPSTQTVRSSKSKGAMA